MPTLTHPFSGQQLIGGLYLGVNSLDPIHPTVHSVVATSAVDDRIVAQVDLQDGPIKVNGVNGLQADHLLLIARHLLLTYNVPPHNNRHTSLAITAIEDALARLHARTVEREQRGVEGTGKP